VFQFIINASCINNVTVVLKIFRKATIGVVVNLIIVNKWIGWSIIGICDWNWQCIVKIEVGDSIFDWIDELTETAGTLYLVD
jgi:hypothetical protein